MSIEENFNVDSDETETMTQSSIKMETVAKKSEDGDLEW